MPATAFTAAPLAPAGTEGLRVPGSCPSAQAVAQEHSVSCRAVWMWTLPVRVRARPSPEDPSLPLQVGQRCQREWGGAFASWLCTRLEKRGLCGVGGMLWGLWQALCAERGACPGIWLGVFLLQALQCSGMSWGGCKAHFLSAWHQLCSPALPAM